MSLLALALVQNHRNQSSQYLRKSPSVQIPASSSPSVHTSVG